MTSWKTEINIKGLIVSNVKKFIPMGSGKIMIDSVSKILRQVRCMNITPFNSGDLV